uniref:Uncharacterized protein n=1 Tax=Moniliophthora roreri TaxID=221103 RepID=A0A0W0ETU5_MONRR
MKLDIGNAGVDLNDFVVFLQHSKCHLMLLFLIVEEASLSSLDQFLSTFNGALSALGELHVSFGELFWPTIERETVLTSISPVTHLLPFLQISGNFCHAMHVVLLAWLQCPLLTCIDIRSPQDCTVNLLDFFQAAACQIKCMTLKVKDALITDTALCSYLHCPTLVTIHHLCLVIPNANTLISKLISFHYRDFDAYTPWPCLQCLRLFYIQADQTLLAQLADSRYATITVLTPCKFIAYA